MKYLKRIYFGFVALLLAGSVAAGNSTAMVFVEGGTFPMGDFQGGVVCASA